MSLYFVCEYKTLKNVGSQYYAYSYPANNIRGSQTGLLLGQRHKQWTYTLSGLYRVFFVVLTHRLGSQESVALRNYQSRHPHSPPSNESFYVSSGPQMTVWNPDAAAVDVPDPEQRR